MTHVVEIAPEAPDAVDQILVLKGIRKEYPGTLAVDLDPDQSLEFQPGRPRSRRRERRGKVDARRGDRRRHTVHRW